MKTNLLRIGIDASNIGGGGGVTHLKEMLNCLPTSNNKIIIIFASESVLNELPEGDNIKKISFPSFNKTIIHRIVFQLFSYTKYIKQHCDILFSITGDYIGSFKPLVGMSQNMLFYEREIWKDIKHPIEILKFWFKFHRQKLCFKNASSIIFLSEYARNEVSKQINLKDKKLVKINHGISTRFIGTIKPQATISTYTSDMPFKFLYVSTVHVYKHQWNVVESIAQLRNKGYPVELDLVGGVLFYPAGKRLEAAITKHDEQQQFIRNHGHINYDEIDVFYKNADGIIFASTCENMPNILIESMASGIPIACSNKEPMPEFLKKYGFYFDAKVVESITKTLEEFLLSPKRRKENAENSIEEIKKYSWDKTSQQTFNLIKSTYNNEFNNS